MIKFDNAFLCSTGTVGIQFKTEKDIITVFDDGKRITCDERHPLDLRLKALLVYHKIVKRFKSS